MNALKRLSRYNIIIAAMIAAMPPTNPLLYFRTSPALFEALGVTLDDELVLAFSELAVVVAAAVAFEGPSALSSPRALQLV